jgi:hypothetical protein
MANFAQEFMKSVGPEAAKQISANLGIDKSAALKIIPQVIPLILGGLKKQKDEQGGTARVDHILNKYGQASALENIAGLLSAKAMETKQDPGLGGLLGNAGVQAVSTLAKQFNLDAGTASKLIPMLAPLVLGFLTKKRDQGGAGSSGIAALLDQDGDGSILDDVAGFLMQGGATAGKNPLTGLLGGLFGKKS